MSLYLFAVIGCDATTRVILDLSPERHDVLASVVAQVNGVTKYACMPDVQMAEVTITWAIAQERELCYPVGETYSAECPRGIEPGVRYVNVALVDPDHADSELSSTYPTCPACAVVAGYAPDGAA